MAECHCTEWTRVCSLRRSSYHTQRRSAHWPKQHQRRPCVGWAEVAAPCRRALNAPRVHTGMNKTCEPKGSIPPRQPAVCPSHSQRSQWIQSLRYQSDRYLDNEQTTLGWFRDFVMWMKCKELHGRRPHGQSGCANTMRRVTIDKDSQI